MPRTRLFYLAATGGMHFEDNNLTLLHSKTYQNRSRRERVKQAFHTMGLFYSSLNCRKLIITNEYCVMRWLIKKKAANRQFWSVFYQYQLLKPILQIAQISKYNISSNPHIFYSTRQENVAMCDVKLLNICAIWSLDLNIEILKTLDWRATSIAF